jgi:DNA-binding transcriptional LysR family regulator
MSLTPLNALNSFLHVARRLNFTLAAQDLGVSPSALSWAVRQLEAKVGAMLIVRSPRGAVLTDAGQRILDNAGPAIEVALATLKDVKGEPGEAVGRIRLAVPTGAVTLVLARLLPQFTERHPRVHVDISVENRYVNVGDGGFDAGIRLVEEVDRDTDRVRLSGPGRVVVAAAPSYLRRRGVPTAPGDLLQHDLICARFGPREEPWEWELKRGKKTWRIPARGPVTANDSAVTRALAVAGGGLLYAFEAVIADELARGRLRIVLEQYAPRAAGLFLHYPARSQGSRALQAFVDVAREVAEKETGAAPPRQARRSRAASQPRKASSEPPVRQPEPSAAPSGGAASGARARGKRR